MKHCVQNGPVNVSVKKGPGAGRVLKSNPKVTVNASSKEKASLAEIYCFLETELIVRSSL